MYSVKGDDMNHMMSHKGYYGSVQYSDEDEVFFGKIEFIKALVNYEGTSIESLKAAFQEAVDDYLQLCGDEGMTPEKPFDGIINIHTKSDLHRKAALYAKNQGVALNDVVTEALDFYLSNIKQVA